MTTLSAALLGFIEGLTEFVPVSSTGHLVVVRDILALPIEGALAQDAVLQLATVLAAIVYFRADLFRLAKTGVALVRRTAVVREDLVLLGAVAFGTLPALAFGLMLEEMMGTVFRNPVLVAYALFAGSLLLVVAERHAARQPETQQLSVRTGFLIGCCQALALVPGFSRSGATIAGGLLLGLSRENAARFAFILSIPIVLGSGGKKLFELGTGGAGDVAWLPLFVGSAVAFASGLLAIHFLLRFLKTRTLLVFAAYRVALATLILLYF